MKRLAVLALAVLALAQIGCGANGDEGTSTTDKVASEAQPQIVVTTASRDFDPAEVYREAGPGVVTVRAVFHGASGPFGRSGAAEGSGFVLDDEGRIVTNAHVVTDASSGERSPAKAVFVEFSDRNVVPAKIVGFDPFADVALLEIKPDGFDLHPLDLGNDRDLVVGQPVAAIGSPFGEQQTLSVGVISAIDRSVESLTDFQIDGAIQTDAAINPGNSGGPLLDGGANVIGINQQIETQSGANDGVGFAVPISAIKRSVAQLEENGVAEYPYIGVSSQALYPQLAAKLGLDTRFGGLLAEVVSGGPAERAGLRGGDGKLTFQAGQYRTGGDVILQVDGHDVVRPDDLARLVADHRPGEKITVTILRDGEEEDVQVTLGKRPDRVRNG